MLPLGNWIQDGIHKVGQYPYGHYGRTTLLAWCTHLAKLYTNTILPMDMHIPLQPQGTTNRSSPIQPWEGHSLHKRDHAHYHWSWAFSRFAPVTIAHSRRSILGVLELQVLVGRECPRTPECYWTGQAVVVSNSSFTSDAGAAAWTIEGCKVENQLQGKGKTLGIALDHSAYCSELFGIWGIFYLLHQFIRENDIEEGKIRVTCNGLLALREAQLPHLTELTKVHYDLISAICIKTVLTHPHQLPTCERASRHQSNNGAHVSCLDEHRNGCMHQAECTGRQPSREHLHCSTWGLGLLHR